VKKASPSMWRIARGQLWRLKMVSFMALPVPNKKPLAFSRLQV